MVRRGTQADIGGGGGAGGQLPCLHPLHRLLPDSPSGPVDVRERQQEKCNQPTPKSINTILSKQTWTASNSHSDY